jgi:hypothetical protein
MVPAGRLEDAVIPETVFGLPAHVLIVHGVVVLVPLTVLGTFAIAVVRSWRDRYGPLVAAVAVVAAINAFVAVLSGQAFKERLEEDGMLGGEVADKVEIHEALGSALRWYTLVLAVAVVALVVMARRGAGRNLIFVIAVVSVIAAGAAGVQVIRTGHAGSTAVWNPTG